MDYQQALAALAELARFGVNPGLQRITELLRRLGHPERRIPHYIHIGGTNGKGSVAALCEAMLRAGGRRTALFSSPHLHSHTERYRIDGRPIAESRFAELFAPVYAQTQAMIAEGWESPTEFELSTALAFLCFAEAGVEWAVIEVGMGGAIDSTNVINAEIAVITPVALDHMQYLGATVPEIARVKAGIIGERRAVVNAAGGEAAAVIAARAAQQGCREYRLGRDYLLTERGLSAAGGRFDYRDGGGEYRDLFVTLAGRHQLQNAATAVAAMRLAAAGENAVRAGLRQVVWPARLELIGDRPPVLLDGAHNVQGMQALTAALDELWPDKRIIGLIAMLDDKQRRLSLQTLLPRLAAAVITRSPYGARAADWQAPAAICRESGLPVQTEADNARALALAMAQADGANDLVLVCGSLYMVAAVRECLLGEGKDLCTDCMS
ncbi:MAG: folylpolyglutamate synthase/dihydrofolate synthase family protein [Bacillota bacterium]|nr:folylpolyglutamate synthase/dihydrofolate synthase family protein [Bacillota bacterium]